MNSVDTPPPTQPAAPAPSWTKRLMKVFYGVVAVIFGLIALAKIITWNDLPGCDSTRAKDTLSTIFKEKKVNASRYDEITTRSKTDDEVLCSAKLTLQDDSKVAINYRLFRENSEMRLVITDATAL